MKRDKITMLTRENIELVNHLNKITICLKLMMKKQRCDTKVSQNCKQWTSLCM